MKALTAALASSPVRGSVSAAIGASLSPTSFADMLEVTGSPATGTQDATVPAEKPKLDEGGDGSTVNTDGIGNPLVLTSPIMPAAMPILAAIEAPEPRSTPTIKTLGNAPDPRTGYRASKAHAGLPRPLPTTTQSEPPIATGELGGELIATLRPGVSVLPTPVSQPRSPLMVPQDPATPSPVDQVASPRNDPDHAIVSAKPPPGIQMATSEDAAAEGDLTPLAMPSAAPARTAMAIEARTPSLTAPPATSRNEKLATRTPLTPSPQPLAASGVRPDQTAPDRTRLFARTSATAEPADPPDVGASPPIVGDELRPIIVHREPALVPLSQTSTATARADHDFGAIVDRLVEARQTGASMTVSATVPHREFGQVRIGLSETREGLTIALSSPDPAFAPVADAAIRVAAPASERASPSQPTSTPGFAASELLQDATGQRGGGSAPPPPSFPRSRDSRTGATHTPEPARGQNTKPGGGVYA